MRNGCFGDLRMCVDEFLGARPTLETYWLCSTGYIRTKFLFVFTFTNRLQEIFDQQELSFNTSLNSTGEAVFEIFWLLDMPASSMLGVSMAC